MPSAFIWLQSEDFSIANGLPVYKYLLQPRVKGLELCVLQLTNAASEQVTSSNISNDKSSNHDSDGSSHGISAIYDITIGFDKGHIPQNEMFLVNDNLPSSVHMHIKRHAIQQVLSTSALPSSSATTQSDEPQLQQQSTVSRWCQAQWDIKEALLQAFYTGQQHSKNSGANKNKVADQFQFPDPLPSSVMQAVENRFMLQQAKAILFWNMFMMVCLYLLFTHSVVFYYFIAAHVVFFLLAVVGKGLDNLEVSYHNHSPDSSPIALKKQT